MVGYACSIITVRVCTAQLLGQGKLLSVELHKHGSYLNVMHSNCQEICTSEDAYHSKMRMLNEVSSQSDYCILSTCAHPLNVFNYCRSL